MKWNIYAKKIKVLMIVPNLRVSSGVTSFVMNYFRTIDHNKIQMDFAIYWDIQTPNYDEIKKDGGKVYILPSIKNIKDHLRVCKRIIREGNYDIVHDNTLLISIGLMYYAQKYNVPVRILHSHSSRLGETKVKELRNQLFMPLLRNSATNYCACSSVAAKSMFGNKDVTIIPNMILANKYVFNQEIRKEVREDFNVSGSFLVGTVGRLAPPKNPFYAIDCIIEAKKVIPNLQYWWIGSGPLDKQIKEYISDKKAGGYIHLLGSRSDVSKLYQAMDMFFLPSRFEGLGIAVLEAEATGLISLVSNEIPTEVAYTDLVIYFSLKNSPYQVANLMRRGINCKKDRKIYHQDLLKSIFSEQRAGSLLLSVYTKFLYK